MNPQFLIEHTPASNAKEVRSIVLWWPMVRSESDFRCRQSFLVWLIIHPGQVIAIGRQDINYQRSTVCLRTAQAAKRSPSARAQRVVGPIRLGFSGRNGTNRCKHCASTTEMITNSVFRRDMQQADLDWGLEQANMFSHTYRPKHSLMEIHTSVEGACLSCGDSTIDELRSVLTRQFT